MGIIAVLFLRIFSNDIELIIYASDKNEDADAPQESSDTLYEMGEDFGSILKYIIDFKSDMDTSRSEFDPRWKFIHTNVKIKLNFIKIQKI